MLELTQVQLEQYPTCVSEHLTNLRLTKNFDNRNWIWLVKFSSAFVMLTPTASFCELAFILSAYLLSVCLSVCLSVSSHYAHLLVFKYLSWHPIDAAAHSSLLQHWLLFHSLVPDPVSVVLGHKLPRGNIVRSKQETTGNLHIIIILFPLHLVRQGTSIDLLFFYETTADSNWDGNWCALLTKHSIMFTDLFALCSVCYNLFPIQLHLSQDMGKMFA